jgi:predicted ATPase/DNA-binding winged helix-turn-helix (wHTH) protein
MVSASSIKGLVSFGRYSLIASERLLTKDSAPVMLSARALDILIALVSCPNELVSKNDLLAQVWPDVIVEEGNLRLHVASLRKALGDGKDGARYITTVPGRGYCFVAPISVSSDRDTVRQAGHASFPHANLPGGIVGMVGRDDDVLRLSSLLNISRFVTIVGPGGVGKTTVAIAIANHLIEAFAGAALFVDISTLSDPKLLPTALASMLGLSVQSEDTTPNLMLHLRDKRVLLILDTCEHLVEAAADLASHIHIAAPNVQILATSREALRVEGEHVYRLDPLACPPDDAAITAALVQKFPAAKLFVDRAIASGAHLDLSDAEAAIVAGICRKLDGIALAIELAAMRVEAYGLRQTAALLDQRLNLLWVGRRTAPPRQKTLQATLDWSYERLSETERLVLHRLAVFVGRFTLDAALKVTMSSPLDQTLVLRAIDRLVAKSMVTAHPIGAMMYYRLLDTTRAYIFEIAMNDVDLADLAKRHATYYRQWLELARTKWSSLSTGVERAPYFSGINNVRAALEWGFRAQGNTKIGIGLAAAASQVFLTMSLLPECHRWSQLAILALDDSTRGGSEEMHLQAALGISSMQMYGEDDSVRVALNRSLVIAEEHGDALHQVGLLGMLHMSYFRGGEFKIALDYARRCRFLAGTLDDPAAMALAHSVLGRSLQIGGDLAGACVELKSLLGILTRSQWTSTIYLGYDRHGFGARTLWLLGYPAQALQRANQAIEDVERIHHPASHALVLVGAVAVFLWTGDLVSAEKHIDSLIAHAESNSLEPLIAVGRCRKAELSIWRGNAKEGVASLRASLERIHAVHYELLTTEFNISLVQGLAAIGRFDEAITLVDETIRQVNINGDTTYMPELLRVKGGVLLSIPQSNTDVAEMNFMQSLELSRRQCTRAWELRAAIDMAALFAGRGQSERGRALLAPVFKQFSEGFHTTDLRAAERLLSGLG